MATWRNVTILNLSSPKTCFKSEFTIVPLSPSRLRVKLRKSAFFFDLSTSVIFKS